MITIDDEVIASLSYTNSNGESLNFTTAPDFGFSEVRGLDAASVAQTTTQGYRQHGTTLDFLQLEEREIEIDFTIDAPDRKAFMRDRAKLLRLFAPLATGRLYWCDENFDVYCDCHVSIGPDIPNERGMIACQGTVQLIANDPILYDRLEQHFEIATWSGGWQHTWKNLFRLKRKSGLSGTLLNDGHVPVACRIEFSGPATNPTVHNTGTGQYIAIRTTLSQEQKCVITTHYRNKTVKIGKVNGEGMINREDALTDASRFFQLDVGENLMRFSTNDTNELCDVSIYYRRGFYYV